ncbi:guanylate kinase [Candidatus Pelagibacter communis]|uniref:guanylate kinase n=1 Tax=Pelagibacter ubique TaxID=198252 RepID=UPI00094D2ECB|nr:guanylate kinase [Candidatus Pelagibacter ubique]
MPLKNEGIMIVLSSPSGAGKTTLVKLLSEREGFTISISHTTRTPRSNEINGKDYHFISKEEFTNMINKKEFLEYAEVFQNYYGTSRSNIFTELNKGTNIIFDIDWQGTAQIVSKKLEQKLITFFILPPSREILFRRLSNRDMKDKLIAEERMKEFDKDILHWKNYDYVIINNDLELCYKQILKHINDEINGLKKGYDIKFIEKHIKRLMQ